MNEWPTWLVGAYLTHWASLDDPHCADPGFNDA